ncbi:MAG: lytic murein transglycosylase [Candidatus Magnetoovum sp. WYHC-5]|nr:lytic murein transglycosylase [Candidatus Magnetoovum sp. WYHC-5]
MIKLYLIIFVMLIALFALHPAVAYDLENVTIDIAAPFGIHEERYAQIYSKLIENGVNPKRVKEIFTSAKAKQRDLTPVKMMATRSKVKVFNSAEKRATDAAVENIPAIVKHLARYKAYYNVVEKRYGVNREVIAAILMKETSLGNFTNWKHDAFVVLNSMVSFFEMPEEDATQRQIARTKRLLGYAEDNLVGLILFCEKYSIDILAENIPSSYAGAVGIPQFAPMWLSYTISVEKGVPNLNKMPDAIMSTANILKNQYGWPGLLDYNKINNIDSVISDWYDFNMLKDVSFSVSTHLDGFPLKRYDEEHPEIPNVKYIGDYARILMNYNFSSNYALGILQIAYHTHLNY